MTEKEIKADIELGPNPLVEEARSIIGIAQRRGECAIAGRSGIAIAGRSGIHEGMVRFGVVSCYPEECGRDCTIGGLFTLDAYVNDEFSGHWFAGVMYRCVPDRPKIHYEVFPIPDKMDWHLANYLFFLENRERIKGPGHG